MNAFQSKRPGLAKPLPLSELVSSHTPSPPRAKQNKTNKAKQNKFKLNIYQVNNTVG